MQLGEKYLIAIASAWHSYFKVMLQRFW